MNRAFEAITRFLNGIEDSAINALSAVVPWFVPIIPAYLTFYHTSTDLKFPTWVAWTTAFVVEVLGLASMRTAVKFYEHNKHYTSDERKAPIRITVGIYTCYLIVVLVVNVLLDIKNGVVWWNVLAVGLFSLLSVPAAMLISVRAQHAELLQKLSLERSERRQNRSESSRKVSEGSESPEKVQKVSETLPKDWRKLRPTLNVTDIFNLANLDTEAVMGLAERYGVDPKTVYNWRTRAKQELEKGE